LEGGDLMAEKSAQSKQLDSDLTIEQVKDQLTEIGKKRGVLHTKKLQSVWRTSKLNPIKWMNIMNTLENKVLK
jgi:hypothetical protein